MFHDSKTGNKLFILEFKTSIKGIMLDSIIQNRTILSLKVLEFKMLEIENVKTV